MPVTVAELVVSVPVKVPGVSPVTEICGVMLSDQLSSVPVTPVVEVVSWSVQTPGTHRPEAFLKSTGRPSRSDSIPVGLNDPVKGAVPVVIEVSPASSKTVLMKFAPVPPTPENKGTCIPFGAIRTAVRSESDENAAVSETVMSAILKVPSKLGMVNVESRRAAKSFDLSGRQMGSTAGR